MTLTPETIDRLQAGAAATKHADLQGMTTHVPAIVLMDGPGKTKVESIEHLQEHRARFRGTMTTNSMQDFVKYVVGRKGSPRGFISAERIDDLSCHVYFNLGDHAIPGHGDDLAILKPKMLPAFSVMKNINGKRLSQQELIDWIEDWHHIVTASKVGDDGGYMSTAAAVSAIRTLKIDVKAQQTNTVGNYGASRSALEEVEANREGSLPGFLSIRTAPFDGFKDRTFTLRLSVLTGAEKPALSLRWQQQEHQCEEIAQEFKERLVAELGGLADSLVVGTFALGK
jgi:uncharacterized protein YfdQ (DUF2303 family)